MRRKSKQTHTGPFMILRLRLHRRQPGPEFWTNRSTHLGTSVEGGACFRLHRRLANLIIVLPRNWAGNVSGHCTVRPSQDGVVCVRGYPVLGDDSPG